MSDYRPGAPRRRPHGYANDEHRGHRAREDWQLGGADYALIWRGEPRIVPFDEASSAELATGIASIEAFAVSTLDRFLKANRAHLSADRRQDAIAYLLGSMWVEAKRAERTGFDPARGRIGGYVASRLRWRLMDWYRAEFGKPSSVTLVSLDVDDSDVAHADSNATYFDSPMTREALRHVSAAKAARDEVLALGEEPSDVLGIDPESLTPPARWALAEVALRVAAGWTIADVCREVGRSRRAVAEAMNALRSELAAQGLGA